MVWSYPEKKPHNYLSATTKEESEMPRYIQIDQFMKYVRLANPTFERRSRSGLRPLIDILNDNTCNLSKVHQALHKLRPGSVAKYCDAIWYLQATYPGLLYMVLPMGPLGKTNAAQYTKTPLLPNYDPSTRPHRRHKPPSRMLNQTVEQWLLKTPGTIGIMLIHLSDFQGQMNDMFNGRRVVDHMNSVLRIGQLRGCDLLCLFMKGDPVCSQLAATAKAFGGRKMDVRCSQRHMGARRIEYRNFANAHDNVVVMGFDANICVNANLFGAPEKLPDGSFVPPLTSMTNVVTSRAVLVTDGVIFPVNNQGEYGVLNGE